MNTKKPKLPVCVKCEKPIRQAGKRGVGEWMDYGDGNVQHIVCPISWRDLHR